jgi:hypothetical protein
MLCIIFGPQIIAIVWILGDLHAAAQFSGTQIKRNKVG